MDQVHQSCGVAFREIHLKHLHSFVITHRRNIDALSLQRKHRAITCRDEPHKLCATLDERCQICCVPDVIDDEKYVASGHKLDKKSDRSVDTRKCRSLSNQGLNNILYMADRVERLLTKSDTGGEPIKVASFRSRQLSNVERLIGGLSLVVSH